MAPDALLAQLVVGFQAESQELVQSITQAILGMERAGTDPAALAKGYDAVARNLHTLKGSAATLGLEDLSSLAHALEAVWINCRQAEGPPPATAVDSVFGALDVFMQRLEVCATGGRGLEKEVAELTDHLGGLSQAERVVEPATAVAAAPSSPDAANNSDTGWRIQTRQITELTNAVERLREVCSRLEARRVELDRTHEELEGLRQLGVGAPLGTRLRTTARALEADSQETLDVVASLDEGLRSILTLPVQTLVSSLQRTARDVGRQLNKEVSLTLVGGEVAVDRRMLERLRGPLIHLVRNAVDHGLEAPDRRRDAGKHEEGIITIRVEHVGNLLFLEVADDGAGLDTHAISSHAVKKGLVSADAVQRMDPAQIHNFIFSPGFSTSASVTETSGRGVGMDVVRAQVEALEGRVELHSVAGQGARVAITLPLKLGGSPVLMVVSGEQSFGLPMLAVEATLAAKPANVLVAHGRTQLRYREQVLNIVDLGAVLGLRQSQMPRSGQPLLVLQAGGRRTVLAVDEAAGDMELIIRPMPSELRAVEAYQGTATLPRGEPLLVLRPDWLVGRATEAAAAPGASGALRALVVDDSLTARALHRSMLEAGGYTVHAVSSGAQALQQLAVATYEVMITDVGMENMDGLELTAAVRTQPKTRDLPVVMVSAHDSEDEKARGFAAGADAFLGKRECASGRLLAEVTAVLGRNGGRQ